VRLRQQLSNKSLFIKHYSSCPCVDHSCSKSTFKSQSHLFQPACLAHSRCRLALTLGFGIPSHPAGGDFIRFCDSVLIYQDIWVHNINSPRPGILIFFAVLAQSFVWAVLPFKFAKTLYPAVEEMHTASVMCKEGLLCDGNQSPKQDVSAESCLQRVMLHITAAGITAGRSSEVYGIVMPVKYLCRFHFWALFTYLCQVNIALDLVIIASNLNLLRNSSSQGHVHSSLRLALEFISIMFAG
jgi:hypothetical protein